MKKLTPTRHRGGILGMLLRKTHGQDLIEYAILAGIVTSVAVICLNSISNKVATTFDTVITEVASNGGGGGAGGAGDGGGDAGGAGGNGNGGGGNGRGNGP